MGEIQVVHNRPGVLEKYIMLSKDDKPICRTRCHNPPAEVPCSWSLAEMVRRTKLPFLSGLPKFNLFPAAENHRDQKEWERFLGYLKAHNMVGVMKFELLEFYVLPPAEALDSSYAIVAYQAVKSQYIHHGPNPSQLKVDVKERDSALNEDIRSSDHKFLQAVRDHSNLPTAGTSKPEPCAPKQDGFLEKNYARADPSYLKTLGQAHSGWIFGAIAELVDNSRDAKATKLEISVETIYFKKIGKHIPLLSVIDDGHGMTHQDVVIMTSIGHKQPDDDEPERIGRFGVGFKFKGQYQ